MYNHMPPQPTYDGLSTGFEGYSSLPEVDERSRETKASDPGIEVDRPHEKELAEDFAYAIPMSQYGSHDTSNVFERQQPLQSVSGRTKSFQIMRRVCAVVVVLLVLGLALGLGLGLGLKTDKCVVIVRERYLDH
jgi:hypothetical protein